MTDATPTGRPDWSPRGEEARDRADPAGSSGAMVGASRCFPVIDDQLGLATTEQLRAHGWTADAIRHARGKTIQRVYPGVYASHRGPLDVATRLLAAHLWAGESAVLTGKVALDRIGLDLASLGECLFLVPSTRRVRQVAHARTVRTTCPVRVASYRDGVPITTAARALCDAAIHQGLAGKELEAATISALQRRIALPLHVEEELSRHRRSAVAPIRAGLAHFAKGAWSLPEVALARLLEDDPGLPPFVVNKELWTLDGDRIGCPDGYFPEAGVALQVHSRAYHSGTDERGRDRWTDTVEKDSSLAEHGVVVVPITPSSIDRRPSQVLARIRRALAANSGRDLSHVVVRGA